MIFLFDFSFTDFINILINFQTNPNENSESREFSLSKIETLRYLQICISEVFNIRTDSFEIRQNGNSFHNLLDTKVEKLERRIPISIDGIHSRENPDPKYLILENSNFEILFHIFSLENRGKHIIFYKF